MRKQRWIYRTDIVDYVIDSYAGIHRVGRNRKRLFIWADKSGNLHEGNTEAFVLHLNDKFELFLPTSAASDIHQMLRDLGEAAKPTYPTERRMTGEFIGKFTQPEPESRIIGYLKENDE